ncbi:hypothetical protein V5799_024529 [Amblyomma americanum]|uniref:Uncharacterized protein n=1 Tax=Amblyomma americanum TaxID=6943 RepID=A0AAQ4ECB3_AMBAM
MTASTVRGFHRCTGFLTRPRRPVPQRCHLRRRSLSLHPTYYFIPLPGSARLRTTSPCDVQLTRTSGRNLDKFIA